MSLDDHHHHTKKKRVGKACDLCRIKKTKCDGKKPCLRCLADNKLCAFTDKRKQKEKTHPSGYIDLLETRLDLMTRLLERIVLMAEPHLPVLQDLMARARAEHAAMSLPEDLEDPAVRDGLYVPVNEVVSFLILDLGLLDGQPTSWEHGAHIAARLTPTHIDQATRDFASLKRDAAHDDDELAFAAKSHSRTSSELGDSPDNYAALLAEPLSVGSFLLDYTAPGLEQPQAQLQAYLGLESFPERGSQLFVALTASAGSLLPVLSLANHMESHKIDDTRVRRLLLLKGPMSPSHQKLKLTGHVHKPGHAHHLLLAVVSNNGNHFHIPKGLSSMHSLPDFVSLGLSKNSEEFPAFADDFMLGEYLPKMDNGLLDAEEVLLSNPFLTNWEPAGL